MSPGFSPSARKRSPKAFDHRTVVAERVTAVYDFWERGCRRFPPVAVGPGGVNGLHGRCRDRANQKVGQMRTPLQSTKSPMTVPPSGPMTSPTISGKRAGISAQGLKGVARSRLPPRESSCRRPESANPHVMDGFARRNAAAIMVVEDRFSHHQAGFDIPKAIVFRNPRQAMSRLWRWLWFRFRSVRSVNFMATRSKKNHPGHNSQPLSTCNQIRHCSDRRDKGFRFLLAFLQSCFTTS